MLGAILTADPDTEDVWDLLNVEDFTLPKHQMIYRRMRALQRRGQPVDRVTVATELQAHGELEAVDGLAYLVTLDDGLPIPPHCRRYLEILHELAQRRRSIQASDVFVKGMADLTMNPATLLLEHREPLDALLRTEDFEADLVDCPSGGPPNARSKYTIL